MKAVRPVRAAQALLGLLASAAIVACTTPASSVDSSASIPARALAPQGAASSVTRQAPAGDAALASPTAASAALRRAANAATAPASSTSSTSSARARAAARTPSPAASAPVAPGNPPLAAVAPGNAASGLRAPGNPSAPSPSSGPLRAFGDVVKDAHRIDGALTLWQKDDKYYLELKPDDLNTPFFLSSKLKTGIGERGFFGGVLADSGVIEFRRINNQMQMLWRIVGFTAGAGTPERRAVDAAYSPSLLASTPVLSNPEPDRKSVLVEANSIFLTDLLGIGMDLQRTYRQGYSFDPRNSSLADVRGTPDSIEIDVQSHFATASIAVPQPGAPPGFPVPGAPRTVPDPRSLFLNVHFSLARLPASPMAPRKADQRVGYFESGVVDFSNDLQRTPRQRFINHWRLAKKDPAAALSEPVKPVVFWIDKSIPLKYRAPISAGILEWNRAFEAIGFKDAIKVEVQADDADFDTLDYGRNSIRWMTDVASPFAATGPSHVDPRTGEILSADIGVESLASRGLRALRAQVFSGTGSAVLDGASAPASNFRSNGAIACTYADSAAEQLTYALDLLEARDDADPSSAESDQYIFDYLKSVVMHEVGHTLGLRHNFRASRAYTPQQLADPVFTTAYGIAGSVMDYTPINIGPLGQPIADQGTPFSDTLGPYDYWAIEYGYRPFDAADEAAGLQMIASRSAEPLLGYGSDEDSFLGLDPESLQDDLSSDVVAFAKKRITIAQDLLRRQEVRRLRADQDYAVLRRSVVYAVRDVSRAAGVLARQIGGIRTLRDAPSSGRDPLTPVPFEQQRQALDVITGSLLAADSLKISPALQRRLGNDFLERDDANFGGVFLQGTDFSLSSQVLDLQRALLGVLLSDITATRLLDGAEKAPNGASRSLRVGELYGRLNAAVWSELATGADITPMRRELQRDYVNRIASLMLRPSASSRVDTRSQVRAQAQQLLVKIKASERRANLSAEARGHLQDSDDTLTQAMNARLLRIGL